MTNGFSLTGTIASAGFATGDRIVVGAWRDGPLGAMNDIMWARPDGMRVLIAPSQKVADFISAVYAFDETVVSDVVVQQDLSTFRVECEQLSMTLVGGRKFTIPFGRVRTPKFVRYVEGPIARRLLNVNTYGASASGVEEWYRADEMRLVRSGSAVVNGKDVGEMTSIKPAMNVGVSEPPQRPSIVKVRPLLRDRSGRLDNVVTHGL